MTLRDPFYLAYLPDLVHAPGHADEPLPSFWPTLFL